MAQEGAIYVTKQQAMEFFGLLDAPDDPYAQIEWHRDQIRKHCAELGII
jgi:hypothetical protein